jgi:transcriptional regulator NrdR family protein
LTRVGKGRADTIRIECPHCRDINRSTVENVNCRRGSSNIIRTRRCSKCKVTYYTSEKAISGIAMKEKELRLAFNSLEAHVRVLKNKVFIQ